MSVKIFCLLFDRVVWFILILRYKCTYAIFMPYFDKYIHPNIFLQSITCFFLIIIISFDGLKFLILAKSNLLMFCFVSAFLVAFYIFSYLKAEKIFYWISSESLAFVFKSMIRLKGEQESGFILLHVGITVNKNEHGLCFKQP